MHAFSQQQPCGNASTQAAMNQCEAASYDHADAELNATYKTALARLKTDKAQHQRLVAAQRAWIAFRDAECALATGNADGGSVYPMLMAQCMADLTTRRTAALRGYMQCEEGDLACAIPQD